MTNFNIFLFHFLCSILLQVPVVICFIHVITYCFSFNLNIFVGLTLIEGLINQPSFLQYTSVHNYTKFTRAFDMCDLLLPDFDTSFLCYCFFDYLLALEECYGSLLYSFFAQGVYCLSYSYSDVTGTDVGANWRVMDSV